MKAAARQIGWVAATWAAPTGVHALTTTRVRRDSGNLDNDEPRQSASAPPDRLQWLRQVHGNRCIRSTRESCKSVPEADAAWTGESNLGLVVLTADCVPIVVTDCRGTRIGIAHGGWRGLAAGVIANLIAEMGATDSLLAWIGPAIGRDAYEVGEDVREAMRTSFGRTEADAVFVPGARPGKWHLDLFALSGRLLSAAGVREVYGDRLCTFSEPRFHSHRRNGTSNRMATVIWKEPDVSV